ncbi:hypothetical protein [Oxynema aestuarii]|uniref:Uncharacterized protein n=1 Tax=Oxynema aestuarii AP17 TaxID=2064643 RepID=A0A6H1TRR1_9CYAN|nr:hypothetical protein [Oxynema aestuarii]QIZ69231.1 hypothetical protein HCG48_00360 [Oxynema aestuarii AP17]
MARSVNVAYATYAEGRSQALTCDRSQLLSRRSRFPNPKTTKFSTTSFLNNPSPRRQRRRPPVEVRSALVHLRHLRRKTRHYL